MRAAILGLAASVIAGQALAADYLRGTTYDAPPKPRYRWDGFYVGGQVGYAESRAAFDPTSQSSSLLLPDWPALPTVDTRATSYGGFVGYNAQWGEIVLGTELNYNRTSLHNESVEAVGPVDFTGTMRITDYGSLRFRAGYAWDWVMPYAMVGLAIARADVTRSAMPPNASYPVTDHRGGAITYGYSVGFGVDIGLLHNVFVRGEYEFMQVQAVKGTWANIGTVRAAAALKF